MDLSNIVINESYDYVPSTCARYCAEQSAGGYEQGLLAGASQINLAIYALVFASIIGLIARFLLIKMYSRDMCSINPELLGRRKLLLSIVDIGFYMTLGVSVLLLVWATFGSGISVQ